MTDKGKYKYSDFTIEAPELKALLCIVLAHYPNLHFFPPSYDSSWEEVGREPITFESPFLPLIHNWDRLKIFASLESDLNEKHPVVAELESRIQKSGPRTDLVELEVENQVLRYLYKNDNLQKAREQLKTMVELLALVPNCRKCLVSLEAQTKTRSIQFEYLWTIFPPGEIVYSTVLMDDPQLFIVKQCDNEPRMDEYEEETIRSRTAIPKNKTWDMHAWMYDWDGTSFHRIPVRFRFDQFPGSRAISTLHCHPLKFHETGDSTSEETLKMLLKRGKRFKELCVKDKGHQMFDYHGDALSHGAGFQNKDRTNIDDPYRYYMIRLY